MRQLSCANHPAAAAEVECKPCRKVLCMACTLLLRDGATRECPACGALLLPILGARPMSAPLQPVSNAQARADASQPLTQRLPITVKWLTKTSVLLTLAGVALLQLLGSVLGSYMQFIASGVSAALFLHIVEQTAYGATELDPPDFLDPYDNIVAPFLRMLATLVPFFVALVWGGISVREALHSPPKSWIGELGPALGLLCAWILLWPLMLLVAAITRSVLAVLDPRAWVRVITTMRSDYAIAAGLFYASLIFEMLVLAPALAPHAILRPLLIIPFAWRARLLGEAARPYTDT